ncbi:MAG: hypothetical protein BAJALOKI1v1_1160008 [Promethearchaeota archaeon]|nr:MAG: hypothetical protein BAJALOKI1v1_1160008 [Candidatus Lokiarchaeota archaeon]
MRANLHLHSRYSDGVFWPMDIVQMAKASGLELIALTDHDNLAGNEEFIDACEKEEIKGIRGVEIDCIGTFSLDERSNRNIIYDSEILGYFPCGTYSRTQELLTPVIQTRKKKMEHYLNCARKIFNDENITWIDFETFHKEETDEDPEERIFTYMKPHLFDYLKYKEILDKNMEFGTFQDVYFADNSNKNLADGLEKNYEKLSIEKVVESIKKDKGFAVIPHLAQRFIPKDRRSVPKRLFPSLEERRCIYQAFLNFCKDLGVWGVEIYQYHFRDDQKNIIDCLNSYIREIANGQFNFTYGSDFHGRYSPSDTLGEFYGEFKGFV